MKQLTAKVLAETGLKGANHGLVMTSDGLVLIDTPHKPSDAAGSATSSTPSPTGITGPGTRSSTFL
jgi:hypothetical protein